MPTKWGSMSRMLPWTILSLLIVSPAVVGAEPATPQHIPKRSVVIQAPAPCARLLSVEEPKVLFSVPEICRHQQKPLAQFPVEFGYDTLAAEIYVNGTLWGKQELTQLDRSMLRHVHAASEEKANEMAESGAVSVQESGDSPSKDTAKAMHEHAHSEEFRGKMAKEGVRQQQDLFADELAGTSVDPNRMDAAGADVSQMRFKPVYLAPDERVYLFWSSSIPETTMRAYYQSLDKARDPRAMTVLRGFVGGATKIAPTMELMQRLLIKDPQCVPDPMSQKTCPSFMVESQIDPTLFARYQVTEVPTVVFARGVKQLYGTEGEGSEGLAENYEVGQWWSLKGDAAIDFMLEKINREAKSPTLDQFIAALRSGFFSEKTAQR